MCRGYDKVHVWWWCGQKQKPEHKCPIIALVNHVKIDKARKRHPTQRGTQSRHSLSDCSYLPCRQTHFFSPRGNTRMYNATYLVVHIYRSQAESQFGEALRNQELLKRKLLQKEKRDFGAWWCSVKSNGLFTHRLPRSTLLHWRLIYIFWFIEAHASYFNQGFPYHSPLIPSISLAAILFFPPQCTLTAKNIISFMTDYVFSTWWVNIAFWKWPIPILNLQIDPLGWKAISAERTQSQGWVWPNDCNLMHAIFHVC